MDETVYYFGNQKFREQKPLRSHHMIVPEGSDPSPVGAHWLRERP
jgi:hypothetical protein